MEREVYLMVNDPNGVNLSHQYNGVACSHIEMRGNYTLLGYSNSYVFNPDWWYNSVYRIDERTGGKFLYKGKFEWPDFFNSTKKERLSIEKLFQTDERNKIYYPKIINRLQKEINKLLKTSITFKDKFYCIEINLEEPNYLTEALVPVRLFETKEQYNDILSWYNTLKHGYIYWENCD